MDKKEPKFLRVIHNKTGNIYFVVDDGVIDATSGENDKIMVLYCNIYERRFIREKKEFWKKFTLETK